MDLDEVSFCIHELFAHGPGASLEGNILLSSAHLHLLQGFTLVTVLLVEVLGLFEHLLVPGGNLHLEVPNGHSCVRFPGPQLFKVLLVFLCHPAGLRLLLRNSLKVGIMALQFCF